jgi:four helix bundle protein
MLVKTYRDLRVFQSAMTAAMGVFDMTKGFPADERFSMVDQMRRSSRSVCANIAEGWRKRRYRAHFISKLSDAEAEASETRVWLELARRCGYLNDAQLGEIDGIYNEIEAQLVRLSANADRWTLS